MLNKNLSFYQVSKHVLNKFGMDVAMVHAIIWNSSKTEGGRCKFGAASIGNELHIGHQKVSECINILLDNGYIKVKYDENEYHTKAYVYVPEKVLENISEEEYQSRTLKMNNDRLAKHKEYREANDVNDTTNSVNDTINGVNDTTNSVNDTKNGVNDTPIKKVNIFKENKEKKEGFSFSILDNPQKKEIREAIEYLTGVKCDDKWNEFIDLVYIEEIENKHLWNDFVEINFWGEFDSKYAHPGYFIKLWEKTEFPTYGYDPNFVEKTEIAGPEYTDEEYKQFYIEANKERIQKKLQLISGG